MVRGGSKHDHFGYEEGTRSTHLERAALIGVHFKVSRIIFEGLWDI